MSDSNYSKLIVVEPRGQGGMIHYAYALCNALANQGVSVTLITSTDYELDNMPHQFEVIKLLHLWKTTEKSEPPNNKFLRLSQKAYKSIRRVFRGFQYIFQWTKLSLYLANSDARIVQFGKIEFSFETIFLRWIKNREKTLTQICHEFELREQSNSQFLNFLNNQYNSVYRNFSLLFFHAKENQERFQHLFNLPNIPNVIIPHGNESMFLEAGIDDSVRSRLMEEFNISDSTPVALFFGLIAPSKGVDNLIESFALVQKENPEAVLVISGAPSKYVNMDEIHHLVKELSLDEVVKFDTRYIPIEEVGAWMSLATVVVYPYKSSTQSGSLQVAYTFGKPVIVTDVGGIPEAVEDGKSGLIVPAGNKEKMSESILSLLNNPSSAKKMGEYAKHLSETRFSWDNIASEIVDSYKQLGLELPTRNS